MTERPGTANDYLDARMSRRRLLQLGAGAGTAGLLAACGAASPSAQPSPTAAPQETPPVGSPTVAPSAAETFPGVALSVLGSPLMEGPVIEAGQAWGALTGGSVQIEVVPFTERALKFAGVLSSQDSSVDLLYGASDYVARFRDLLYVDLDELGVDTSGFVPAIPPLLSSGGKLRVMPLHSEMEIFIYNKEYFSAAGLDPEQPPTTWDELFDAAPALTSGSRYPSVTPWGAGAGGAYWLAFYNSIPEAALLSEDRTEILFDNDDGLLVWQTLDRGFKAKFWDPAFYGGFDDYESARVFNGGGAASQINYTELWGQAVSENQADFGTTISKDVVGATVVPGIKPNTSGSTNAFEGLGINQFSQKKEAAFSFAKYLTGAEYQRDLHTYSLPSSRVSVLTDPANLEAFPVGNVLVEQGKYNLNRWAAPYAWGQVFEEQITKLIKGEVTAEQAHENTINGVKEVILKYLTA